MIIPRSVEIVPNAGWDRRVLALRSGRLVTTFAVISTRYVVLIDTLHMPDAARQLLDAVRPALRGGRELLAINTHADWDHAWGNQIFAGPGALHPAPIVGHQRCRSRLLSAEAMAGLRQMQQDDPAAFAHVRLQPPTITFEHELTIHGGDLTFVLLPTPGHTPDHVSVFVPEIATLFAGDAVEDPFPFVESAATLPTLRASLARLEQLGARTALYCHAPATHSPDLIRANRAYFDELERRARAALAAGTIPATLDDASDVEALVGLRFEELPGLDGLDAEERDFYRGGHLAALRAMLTQLQPSAADS